MPKPPSTWKSTERRHALMLEIERTHWALPDGRGRGIATESKTGIIGKYVPKKLMDWWKQAVTNAGDHDPVLIIHPKGGRYDDDIVVISLPFFQELLNALRPTERQDPDDGDGASGSGAGGAGSSS